MSDQTGFLFFMTSVFSLIHNLKMMSILKMAVQKNGRLSEKSLELLKDCGIRLYNGDRKLKTVSPNFPIEILFLRDDDIPQYVEQGVADIGILGLNEVWEKDREVTVLRELGFASCRMSIAVPREQEFPGLESLNGKRIATSYPNILSKFFAEKSIIADIETIGGSVEIAPGIGLSDGIFDIVSTGSTLLTNGLKEVEVVAKSQAVMIASPNLTEDKVAILNKLLFRMDAVQKAAGHKYILLNAPESAVAEISSLLPGMKSPTVLPLAEKGWCSLHSVIREDEFWENIDRLRDLGAQGILVVNLEKMIL